MPLSEWPGIAGYPWFRTAGLAVIPLLLPGSGGPANPLGSRLVYCSDERAARRKRCEVDLRVAVSISWVPAVLRFCGEIGSPEWTVYKGRMPFYPMFLQHC
jgi:hypothetical protein